jgi:hypothetical protein
MPLGLTRVPGPFPLAVTDRAFPASDLALLHGLFHSDQPWQRHRDVFYRCDIAVVDLPRSLLDPLVHEVATVLGMELLPHVRVTAQRMGPTDGSGRHTDRPLAGYEAARLVVQLDEAQGGRFRAFDGDRIWLDRPARPNQAVAFELSDRSHHDVTDCDGPRRTVVFHFWHPANPPDARARLDRLFADLSIADLPPAMDAVMTEAEARLPDETTLEAALVAVLLHHWGEPLTVVRNGYQEALAGRVAGRAGWLVRLHLDGFERRSLPTGHDPFG